MGFNSSDIIVFGRSLGSGPATHLASTRTPSFLILMSPFTSIRNIAKNVLNFLFKI